MKKKLLFIAIFLYSIFIFSFLYADTWTQTTDTDFNAGTKSNVQVSGSGASASVVLDYSSPALSNAGGGTWKYRKPITIDNSGGGALTNYEISVTTDTAVLISAGKMQSDGDDIRVTDSDGSTELSYWIEDGLNTTTTKIWVKIPTLSASSSKTIYMYYGNSSATSASSGSNTFTFFDDFTGTDINGTTWTATGGYSVNGSSLTITTGAVYTDATVGSTPQNFIQEALVNYNNTSASYSGIMIANAQSTSGSNGGNNALAYNMTTSGAGTNLQMWGSNGVAPADYDIVSGTNLYTSLNTTDNYIIGFTFIGSTQLNYFITTSTYNTTGAYSSLGSQTYSSTWNQAYYLWLGNFTGSASGTTDIDDIEVGWVRVHQYAATVPSTSTGTEQNNYATSGTFTSSIYDCTKSSVFGTMTWTDSGVQTLTMKVRTSNDSGMSGATDWASCTNVTKGQDISGLSSVTDSHRYIQYRASLSTTDTTQTPSLNDVSIDYVPDSTAPSSTITSPIDGNNYSSLSSITGTASDNVGGAGVASVSITIQRLDNNQYWNGSSWQASETWLTCTGTTSWSYTTVPSWGDNINYKVRSRAADVATNVETPGTGNTFYFNSQIPSSIITTPANNSYHKTLTTISGTASVGTGTITQVQITIKHNSDNKYWDGDSWETAVSSLTVTGTTSWNYDSGNIWTDGVSYLIRSIASTLALTETPSTGNTFTFDTSAPTTISNLATSIGTHQGYINITWTAPSDAKSGTASYTVKYATFDVAGSPAGTADSWWNSATAFSQTWSVSSSGTTESHTITGLNAGLTYYIGIKTADNVGNISVLSNLPNCTTNTPPSVTVTYPSAPGVNIGSISSGNTSADITWTITDPNSADTHTYQVLISSNSGTSYVSVASSLPNGTTYYSWNTLNHNNLTGKYRVKMIATDEGSMTGEDASDNSFTINNENFVPTVTVTYPNGGESLGGDVTITWTHSDPNTNDSHTFEIKYSIDGGSNYTSLVNGLAETSTSYVWYTTSTPDSNNYKIKIVATDNGGATGYAIKTGEDESGAVFSVNNVNDPPNAFSLLSPTDGGTETSLTPMFDWEDATDPDVGQTLTYTLYIASDINFSNVVLTKTGLTSSRYLVSASDNLQDGRTYYWKVKVQDNGTPQQETYSSQTTWSFIIANAIPRVTSTTPASNAKILPGDIPGVSITFNKRLDESTLNTSNISFVNQEDVAVVFTISYDDVTKTLTLTPSSSLSPSKTFTIILTTGVKDLMGAGLASNYSFSFTTLIEAAQGVTFANKDNTVSVVVEANILPRNSYIKLTELTSANSNTVKTANRYIYSDNTIKSVGVKTYQLQALDASDQMLSTFNGNVTLTLIYPDTDNDGYVDGTNVKESFLQLFKLNETTNQWELVTDTSQDTSNNRITATVGSFSIYTILAYKAPSSELSGLINYPNPFAAGKESTIIAYTLTKDSKVTIYIYNVIGDLVRKMEFDSSAEGGKGNANGYTNRISWNGRNGDGMIVANGTYICQIVAEASDGSGTFKEIRKIAVVK